MKYFFIIISLVAAFFVERSIGTFFLVQGTPLPLTVAMLFFWFWRVSFSGRVLLSLFAGLFLDSISVFASGTYISALFFCALIAQFLYVFFSNRESAITQALVLALLLLCFFILVPLSNALIPLLPGAHTEAIPIQRNALVVAMLVWIPFSACTLLGLLWIRNKEF